MNKLEERYKMKEFYEQDLDEIKKILQGEDSIDPIVAQTILKNTYEAKGDAGLAIIPYIKCSKIGLESAIVFEGLKEIEIIRELLTAINFSSEADFDIDWMYYCKSEEKTNNILREEIRHLKKEIVQLKKTCLKYEKKTDEKKPGVFQRIFKRNKDNEDENYSNDDDYYKITFIGPQGSGKTALAQRIQDNSFPNTYRPTVGVSIHQSVLKDPNDQLAEYRIWDTTGQEELYPLLPLYLEKG